MTCSHPPNIVRSLLALVGASSALLATTDAQAADLERHPYLQMAGPERMTVVWTTLAPSSGAVEFGTAPDQLTTTVQSDGNGTQHEVTLEGLTPGTRYYYRVLGDDAPLAGGDDDHFFRTNPPPGTRDKFRAWVVGDSGTGGDDQLLVRDAMLSQVGAYLPDLYLHVGDMAYDDGTHDEFTTNFYAPYQGVLRNTPIWPAIGNHEGATSESAGQTGPYYEGYVLPTAGQLGGTASGTEAYYAFDYANVHFVVLDSHDSDRDVDGPMLTWLSQDLMSTEQEWIIAYWHHPPYTKGSHDSDDESKLIEMRENALPILEAGGVDLVLGGHSHIYERTYLLDSAYQTPSEAGVGVLDESDGRVDGDGPYSKPSGLSSHNGAVYVVAGHGGKGVSSVGEHPLVAVAEVEHGSCIIDVQENRLSMINIRGDGMITDRVSILKGDGVVVDIPDGGETFGAGTSTPIQWATVGDIPSVNLEYSVDDGESWTTIAEDVPNEGSYTWVVPAADTERALVRVSDASDPQRRDESNAGFNISSEVPLTPIDFGHVWKYHDSGEDLGEDWMAAAYDDAQWPEGPGQFGYGDDDEATVLEDAEPNFPSAYFRTQVTLDADTFIDAEITALFDDAAVVWINGQEVFRANIDGVAYEDWASDGSEENEVRTHAIDPSVFQPGANIVAAMAKQASEGSSDLSFDLRLNITAMVDPPPGGDDGGDDSATGGNGDGGDDGDGDGGPVTGGQGSGPTGGGIEDGGAELPTAGADGDPAGCGCQARERGSNGWLFGLLPVLWGWRRRLSRTRSR